MPQLYIIRVTDQRHEFFDNLEHGLPASWYTPRNEARPASDRSELRARGHWPLASLAATREARRAQQPGAREGALQGCRPPLPLPRPSQRPSYRAAALLARSRSSCSFSYS